MHSILTLGLIAGLLFAEAAVEPDCGSAVDYRSLLVCAEARAPEVVSARLELETAKKQVGAAGQWRNPELSVQAYRGRAAGESRAETDVSLAVPVELGKIGSRRAVAQSGVSLAEARLFESRARVRTELLVKLHRLRQVLHERDILDESVGAFTKLIAMYAGRPGLNPEQQISTSIFQLSRSEYDLKRSANSDEQLEMATFFRVNVGLDLEQVKRFLPPVPSRWPTLAATPVAGQSPKQKLLQAEVNQAKAQLRSAKSESWPTLMIGPSVQMLEEARTSDRLFGFNVSLPLPLFNANGAGRAAAAAGLAASEGREALFSKEQNLRRQELLTVYSRSVKALASTVSHEEVSRRHEQAEKLFIKGVVTSSIVIETHRTSYELERSRHERELKALESMLSLYAIDGTIMEVEL